MAKNVGTLYKINSDFQFLYKGEYILTIQAIKLCISRYHVEFVVVAFAVKQFSMGISYNQSFKRVANLWEGLIA